MSIFHTSMDLLCQQEMAMAQTFVGSIEILIESRRRSSRTPGSDCLQGMKSGKTDGDVAGDMRYELKPAIQICSCDLDFCVSSPLFCRRYVVCMREGSNELEPRARKV